jgi:AcrR family transcriptional regulator
MSSARTPVRPYGGVSAEDRVSGRREGFLAAGLELFGTRGFASCSVKDVCREAGLTDRYFYESFAGSEQLLVAVFDRVTDELFMSVAEAVAAVESEPEPQLRAAIGTFVRALAEDPRKRRVVFTEAAVAGADAERHMRTTLRRFTELVAATARPHLPPRVPDDMVHVLALALVGMMERVVIEWQDGELDLPIEGIVDHCATLFLRLTEGLG